MNQQQHGKWGSCETVLPSSDKRHFDVATKESYDQKALHCETPLQSLAQNLGSRKHKYAHAPLTPNASSLKAS
ncbi:hypothetical protein ACFX1R_040223 [Malus domestica]